MNAQYINKYFFYIHMLPDLFCSINRNFTEFVNVANTKVLLFRWHNQLFFSQILTTDVLNKDQWIDCEI